MSIKPFFIIMLILFFCSAFCINIGGSFLPLFIVFELILLFLILIFDNNHFFSKLVKAYRYTPFKYFLWFCLWCLITTLISIVSGYFNPKGVVMAIGGGFLLSLFVPYILTLYGLKRIISLKNLIKFITIILFSIFLLGIFDFIIFYCHLTFLENIFTIIINKRSIISGVEFSKAGVFGVPRVQSIFEEPSFLGFFILLTSPFLYSLCLSKNKIFNNKSVDKFLKKSTLILAPINLVLTQSPMYLFLCFVVSVTFFLYRSIRKNPKKFILTSSYIALAIITFLFVYINIPEYLPKSMINIEGTYLMRVVKTIESIESFDLLIYAEPSLATRIISYVNMCIIGFKNIVFGVGYGNLSGIIAKQLLNSPLPLTSEALLFAQHGSTSIPGSIIYRLFSETGLPGLLLFLYFAFRSVKIIDVVKSKFTFIEKDFLIGLKYCLTFLIVFSFYDSNIHYPVLWFLFALVPGIVLITREKQ